MWNEKPEVIVGKTVLPNPSRPIRPFLSRDKGTQVEMPDGTYQSSGLILVVSAPSGGGKTSLCQRLLEWSDNIIYSISCTTRTPRNGEEDGKDYFFISNEEFERRIARNELLEYAQYNGHYYGTPRKYIEDQIRAGRDVLLDIEVQGAAQLAKRIRGQQFAYPESLVQIFLMPPSLRVLERRLRNRNTDDEATIQKRLVIAEREMSHWAEYDYIIVSGQIDEDFDHAKSIITAEKCKVSRQARVDGKWQQKK